MLLFLTCAYKPVRSFPGTKDKSLNSLKGEVGLSGLKGLTRGLPGKGGSQDLQDRGCLFKQTHKSSEGCGVIPLQRLGEGGPGRRSATLSMLLQS